MKPSHWRLGAISLISLLAAPIAAPQSKAPVDPIFQSRSGVAVRGYDAVAYFREGKPVKGNKAFSANYQGATFLFASTANREEFRADPAKYTPQYGGYCAWAVAHGYTAPTDPDAFRIVDGKLYLNYSKNVGKKWAEDIPGHIKAGDANWPKLHK